MTDAAGPSHPSERVALEAERRWSVLSAVVIVVLAAAAAFAGIHTATMPQAKVEVIDPATLHLGGEFRDENLGSVVEADGSVTVRAIAQQYSFSPTCLLVPIDTPVTLRATSPDVLHGLLIRGTNVNIMLVPGYISSIPTKFSRLGEHLMPCQEFCGIGHEGMWARVKVVDKETFKSAVQRQGRAACDRP